MNAWFGKKKNSDGTRTPDGTTIIRHDAMERRLGFPEGDAAGFQKAREAAYEKLFGRTLNVSHELLPQIPHMDVYVFKRIFNRPEGAQDAYVLVTGGMSDLEMTLPPQAKKLEAARRVELIFYCAEPREEYISTLRWIAHFPHDSKSWLGPGHTMPNGDPPAPFWGSTELDTFLFMPPIVTKDQTLPEELQLAGDAVHFLWVVPLTTLECNFKLKKGFDAILNLFQQKRHPHIFDPHRKSYV